MRNARLPQIANVPTLDEAGIGDFDVNSWDGVMAPAKTPTKIIAVLNCACLRILATLARPCPIVPTHRVTGAIRKVTQTEHQAENDSAQSQHIADAYDDGPQHKGTKPEPDQAANFEYQARLPILPPDGGKTQREYREHAPDQYPGVGKFDRILLPKKLAKQHHAQAKKYGHNGLRYEEHRSAVFHVSAPFNSLFKPGGK
jgi:Tripartite tricarboxylate transporter family receptor